MATAVLIHAVPSLADECVNETLRESVPGLSSIYKFLSADDLAAQKIWSQKLSEEFPRLSPILKDPDRFISTMRERFRAQRMLDRSSPYQFDYSEIGIPIIQDLRLSISMKIAELTKLRAEVRNFETEPSISKHFSETGLYLRRLKTEDLDITIQHLQDLGKEADGYLVAGKVSYQDTLEFSTFSTRAIGHFDPLAYPLRIRMFLEVDRGIEGYDQLTAKAEYERYKNREFKLFHTDRKITSEGFGKAGPLYEAAAQDPNRLRVIVVPTNDNLNDEVLLRLLSRKEIALAGVTHDPILADGFMRPSGDFWIHDLRHESGKYYEHILYSAKHRLTPFGEKILAKKQDKWLLELTKHIAAIQDHQLQEAVRLLMFNFHHDRGFPLIPTVYLNWKKDRVVYGLYSAMKIGKQEVHFSNPLLHFGRADRWLREFWKPYLQEELNTLNLPGVRE